MADLVLLHHENDGNKVFVNRDHILYMDSNGGGAALHLRDNKVVSVAESPETVVMNPPFRSP